MEAGFRKAGMVELHDAKVVVYAEGTTVEDLSWRHAPTVAGTSLSVDGNALGHLLQALGVNLDADLLFGETFDVLVHAPHKADDRPPEVVLQDEEEILHDVWRINEVWVRVEGERRLHIHLHVTAGGEDGEQVHVQEMTYSGSYSIWWARE